MSLIPALLIAGVAIAAYVISIYNSLQILKTQILASIQEIGNQLKRQASLIPNLQASVKGLMKQEKTIFKMLTDARKNITTAQDSGKVADIEKAIQSVQSLVPQISIAIEDNPELKSNEAVSKLMNELTDTADKLMYSRRSVIDLSQSYNQKLVVFPSSIVANIFGFKEEKGLATAMTGSHVEVSATEMEDVKVDL
ncbi:MAG: LemA family protein [Candidatus Pacebacteria bacterium]|nr:LemA family protein [Candidatus Paceibacterota bacterium]